MEVELIILVAEPVPRVTQNDSQEDELPWIIGGFLKIKQMCEGFLSVHGVVVHAAPEYRCMSYRRFSCSTRNEWIPFQ